MKISDIRKIADKRTPGRWTFDAGNYNVEATNNFRVEIIGGADNYEIGTAFCNCETDNHQHKNNCKLTLVQKNRVDPYCDLEFCEMAANNIDKLLKVVAAAKVINERDICAPIKSYDNEISLSDLQELQKAFEELENE